MFKKTIITICCTVILTFNFTMSYAKANTAAAQFEEWASATYAGVVTATTAVAAGAMHTQEYLADNITEIYNTAKETWPKMSQDMKSNFLQSLDTMADGVIAVGDWITSALDALRANPTINAEKSSVPAGVVQTNLSCNYYMPAGFNLTRAGDIFSGENACVYFSYRSNDYLYVSLSDSKIKHSGFLVIKTIDAKPYIDFYKKNIEGNKELSMSTFSQWMAQLGIGITHGGVEVGQPVYNRLDEWLRERAIPNGQLRVYNPGAHAYTPDGYRLGLSSDGQTLLKLPDGIPWEGAPAQWHQPVINPAEGAILDTAVGSWIDIATGQKIRDATAAEIAGALGVTTELAEQILTRAKEQEGTGGGQTGPIDGKLKNPTKKLVWTPLMMAGTAMTTKFPFSLPWDLMGQLKIFDASPQAPKFEVNIPEFLKIEDTTIPLKFTIDLSMFDKVATMVRWFNIIIWDIALILILRKLLPE